MRIDIEHGVANRIYRAFAAFLPWKGVPHRPLTLETLARRYARGNVKLQMGLIMTEEEFAKQYLTNVDATKDVWQSDIRAQRSRDRWPLIWTAIGIAVSIVLAIVFA